MEIKMGTFHKTNIMRSQAVTIKVLPWLEHGFQEAIKA
jgi:hypothetical protein